MLAVLLSVLALSAPQVIATGNAPCGASAGFGSVWVANDGSGTLVRIDPRTNRVVGRVRVGPGVCSTRRAQEPTSGASLRRGAGASPN